MARDVDRMTPDRGEVISLRGADGRRITVKLRHRTRSEYARLVRDCEGLSPVEFLEELLAWFICGWSGVRFCGRMVPFGRQALIAMLAMRPDLAAKLVTAINERVNVKVTTIDWRAEQVHGEKGEDL